MVADGGGPDAAGEVAAEAAVGVGPVAVGLSVVGHVPGLEVQVNVGIPALQGFDGFGELVIRPLDVVVKGQGQVPFGGGGGEGLDGAVVPLAAHLIVVGGVALQPGGSDAPGLIAAHKAVHFGVDGAPGGGQGPGVVSGQVGGGPEDQLTLVHAQAGLPAHTHGGGRVLAGGNGHLCGIGGAQAVIDGDLLGVAEGAGGVLHPHLKLRARGISAEKVGGHRAVAAGHRVKIHGLTVLGHMEAQTGHGLAGAVGQLEDGLAAHGGAGPG